MTFGHGAIVSAFVLVAALLLGLSLWSRWSLRVKTAGIVTVTVAWVAVYLALPHLLGWPTDSQVPRRFHLYAVYLQDPDPATGEAGSVFFWARDLAPGADPRPRAFRMPFKASYKSVFQEAQGKLRQNIPQEGEIELADEPEGVSLDWSQLGQKSVKLKFRDAPVNLPPTKGTP